MSIPGAEWHFVDIVMLDMDGTILDLAFDNYFWTELLPRRYAEHKGISRAKASAQLAPIFSAQRGCLNWYCLDFWRGVTGLDLASMKAEICDQIAALPGSIEFLESVQKSGRQLWLVTNAHPASWRLKMAKTGLARYFSRIVCAHDYRMPKEDARFWERLKARYPFDPGRVLFVDDDPTVLRAAQKAGIAQLIAVGRPDTSRPRRDITDLPSIDELRELLPVRSRTRGEMTGRGY